MKIEWTEPALSDLENIQEYIGRDSEYYAVRFVQTIVESAEHLERFSQVGRRIPETDDESVRELLVHNYRVIYRVEPGRILMLAILHGARDLRNTKPKPWEIA